MLPSAADSPKLEGVNLMNFTMDNSLEQFWHRFDEWEKMVVHQLGSVFLKLGDID
jgi:hypothetical protein